jgi:dihydrodiol dehydrogenase / D-xylose 1-dehydrogenase (NADP)
VALNSGKHTLVEKPMTMKADDAQFLYDLGKKKQLFVGEGMWTRFFPAVEWTRSNLGVGGRCNKNSDSDSGGDDKAEELKIGNVRIIQADFSIDGNDVGPYPTDFLYAKELGSGSAWTMLPYVGGAALLPFGREPDGLAANGIIPADDVGDVAVGMTMTFTIDQHQSDRSRENNGPPANMAIASGFVGYLAESSEVTMYVYVGKSGRITVNVPAHCPTSATLIRKSIGNKGNGATSDSVGDSSSRRTAIKVGFPLSFTTKKLKTREG